MGAGFGVIACKVTTSYSQAPHKFARCDFACESFHKRVCSRPHHVPDDKNRFARGFGEGYSYVAVGFQLAAVILVFGGLGWVVDGWLHTRPLLAIAGFLVGTVAGS